MGVSDSDSENDEFESAEESLDEEDTKKDSLKVSESSSSQLLNESSENIASNLDANIPEKSVSRSLSYRKRPERIKQQSSVTSTKSITKSPSNELIFKPDRISPDVIFQDITSNVSKNISKSFNTFQQTSSNVKDLILNSLPVTSSEKPKGFTYDEGTTVEENDAKSDTVSQIKQTPKETKNVFTDNLIATGIGLENKATEAIFSVLDKLTGIKKEKQLPDIKSQEINEKVVNDAKIDESNTEEELKPLKTIDNAKPVSDESEKTVVSDVKNSANEKTIDDEGSLGMSKSDNKFSESSEVISKTSETETVLNKSSDENKEISEDLNKYENSALKDNKLSETLSEENLMKSDQISNNDAKPVIEEELNDKNASDIDLKCNLEISESDDVKEEEIVAQENQEKFESDSVKEREQEEIKITKDIVLEDKDELDVKDELDLDNKSAVNINNEISQDTEKEDGNSEEKVDLEKETTNDGWDDFDFSDNEVDNEIDNQENKKTVEIDRVKSNTQPPVKSETVKPKNVMKLGSKKPIDSTLDKPKEKCDKINNEMNKKNVEKRQEVDRKVSTEQQPENLPAAEDSWDWDAWDENSEAEKKNVSKNAEDDSISKWQGWDTFGQKQQEKQGNWGLGSWGVDALLNKASAVTQGISNVLEAGLGAPDPETLARMEKIEREKLKDLKKEDSEESVGEVAKKNSLTNVNIFPVSGITNLVAGVTSKIVEHSKIQEIGSKVIIGGLDTLESFGKKTMEVLQEGDPGLKNKRALLLGKDKPVLSQVLKEAREKADKELKAAEEKEMAKKCHFETLFDDYQGMVHLEALEMLSTQCELKLDQLRNGMNDEEKEDLNGILEEVEQLCALDECDIDLSSSVLDFKTLVEKAVEPLKNEISVYSIIQIHNNVDKWLEVSSSNTAIPFSVLHQKFVSTVAELAAATVQQFHKSGELLSVKECRKTVEEVDALSRLTNILCSEINKICDRFISLSQNKNPENNELINEKVSAVRKNSTSYIRQAFDLLIPVLQLGAAV